MGGFANSPSNPMNPLFDPNRLEEQKRAFQSQVPEYAQSFIPNMLNNAQQFGQPLNDPLNRGGMPFQGFNLAGTDADPRRPFVSPNPLQTFNQNQVYAGGTPNFDERTGTYINPQQPKPMPLPGRRIIDPPRPGYGQRPQRGPVPRDMTPVTLQQGLGGLGALPITKQQIG